MLEGNTFYMLISIAAAAGGFIAGVLGSRYLFRDNYKRYSKTLHSQYCFLLNNFGIIKKGDGKWYMHDKDEVWVKKE